MNIITWISWKSVEQMQLNVCVCGCGGENSINLTCVFGNNEVLLRLLSAIFRKQIRIVIGVDAKYYEEYNLDG